MLDCGRKREREVWREEWREGEGEISLSLVTHSYVKVLYKRMTICLALLAVPHRPKH